MSALVPCPACRRHVRCHETTCAFCGAQRAPSECRKISLPRGLKRGALFALGLTLAGQACAEDNDVPIYGAPSPPGGGGSGGSGGTMNGSGGDSVNVPVYGAVVPPTQDGGSGGMPGGMSGSGGMPGSGGMSGSENSDAGNTDAGLEDAGSTDAGDPDAS